MKLFTCHLRYTWLWALKCCLGIVREPQTRTNEMAHGAHTQWKSIAGQEKGKQHEINVINFKHRDDKLLWDFGSKCCQCRAAAKLPSWQAGKLVTLPSQPSCSHRAQHFFLQFVCGFTCPSLVPCATCVCVLAWYIFYLFGRMLCCRYLILFRSEIDLTLGFYLLCPTPDTPLTQLNFCQAVNCQANIVLNFSVGTAQVLLVLS